VTAAGEQFLAGVIRINSVSEKKSGAEAKQEGYEERHERSSGNTAMHSRRQ